VTHRGSCQPPPCWDPVIPQEQPAGAPRFPCAALACRLVPPLHSLYAGSVWKLAVDCGADPPLAASTALPASLCRCWQPWLPTSPSLATGDTGQQLQPQPFRNLTKSLAVVSVARLEGARPPARAGVGGWGCAAARSRPPALRHDGGRSRVGRLEGGEARCCSS